MKILYGVQGTGNGHISRARAIGPHLEAAGAEVTYLFSGRAAANYFDMEQFGNWQCKQGMSLVAANGKVKILATAKRNNPLTLWREINSLNLDDFDLVISDFEPITAWAARRQKKPSLAVGHQYAFQYPIPQTGDSLASRMLMKYFAPCEVQLGLHWHHFNQPILPPICDLDDHPRHTLDNKIVVYLGFESAEKIIPLLQQFPEKQFYYYGEFKQSDCQQNVHLRPVSRDGFKRDLADCYGVITNAGFELVSEALHLGKRILVKPLHGQMEQLSNALALTQLQLGQSTDELTAAAIRQWLNTAKAPHCQYPNVAKAIANWIMAGDWSNPDKLAASLWAETEVTLHSHSDDQQALSPA